MSRKNFLHSASKKCLIAIMTAAMMMSSAAAALADPITVCAEQLADNPSGSTVSIGAGDTMENNWGTIGNNAGTLSNNMGTVQSNTGTVSDNYGNVTNTSDGSSTGQVVENHTGGTVTGGNVGDNYGTVNADSSGNISVTNNYPSGTVTGNGGGTGSSITNNYGTATDIHAIAKNYGTVSNDLTGDENKTTITDQYTGAPTPTGNVQVNNTAAIDYDQYQQLMSVTDPAPAAPAEPSANVQPGPSVESPESETSTENEDIRNIMINSGADAFINSNTYEMQNNRINYVSHEIAFAIASADKDGAVIISRDNDINFTAEMINAFVNSNGECMYPMIFSFIYNGHVMLLYIPKGSKLTVSLSELFAKSKTQSFLYIKEFFTGAVLEDLTDVTQKSNNGRDHRLWYVSSEGALESRPEKYSETGLSEPSFQRH